MTKYSIVTESAADLSRAMIEKYDIRIAQLRVEFGGEDYYDDLVSMEELTGYYDRTGNVPTTSGERPDSM